MSKLRIHLVDDYLVCETCQLDVRVPHQSEIDHAKTVAGQPLLFAMGNVVPNRYNVVEEHQKLGHTGVRCYTRSSYWPPDIPPEAPMRVIARLTLGDSDDEPVFD